MATKCAKLVCIKCEEEWGSIIKYSNAFLPMLKVKAFQLESKDPKEHIIIDKVKTWSQIQKECFNIKKLTSKNIVFFYFLTYKLKIKNL